MQQQNNGLCYISTGMQFSPDRSKSLRADLTERLLRGNFLPIDILHVDETYEGIYGVVPRTLTGKNDTEAKLNILNHYVRFDIAIIDKMSDFTLLVYDESARRSGGCLPEAQMTFESGKPLFIISDYPEIEKDVPGWILSIATKVFTSVDACFEYLYSLPAGTLRAQISKIYNNSPTICLHCGEICESYNVAIDHCQMSAIDNSVLNRHFVLKDIITNYTNRIGH